MSRPRLARGSGDDGAIGVDVLALGVLVFVLVTLLIANTWAVIDAKLAVTAAAREGARAFVEAPDQPTAVSRAQASAEAAMVGHGRGTGLKPLLFALEGSGFTRCARVQVTASYDVPAIPGTSWMRGLSGPVIPVSATHTELVDAFRSGVPSDDPLQGALGAAECAR